MDHGHRPKYRMETRRLLWLLGVTFAVVMVFQHFELPYGSVLSSLLSTGKVSFQGKSSFPAGHEPSNSELIGNTTLLNDLNSTKTIEASDLMKETDGGNDGNDRVPKNDVVSETKGRSNGASEFVNQGSSLGNLEEQNKNSSLVKFENSENGGALEKPGEAEHSISSKNVTTDRHTEDEKPGPLQSNLTLSNYSSPVVNKRSETPTSEVMSISRMNSLLLLSRVSPQSAAPQWSSPVDQELLYAKAQIENASNIKNDAELYRPLYRNVSMFKRSYELMENMLKVYIYKEGEKPIFHESILEGIYSSEGWFIKLMEASKHFVTEDPTRAHLFFLPFSSRLLELTLYVHNSHSRSNLIEYMKNHVEMLAAMHPFWNRTGGADHFLTACHDWV